MTDHLLTQPETLYPELQVSKSNLENKRQRWNRFTVIWEILLYSDVKRFHTEE